MRKKSHNRRYLHARSSWFEFEYITTQSLPCWSVLSSFHSSASSWHVHYALVITYLKIQTLTREANTLVFPCLFSAQGRTASKQRHSGNSFWKEGFRGKIQTTLLSARLGSVTMTLRLYTRATSSYLTYSWTTINVCSMSEYKKEQTRRRAPTQNCL